MITSKEAKEIAMTKNRVKEDLDYIDSRIRNAAKHGATHLHFVWEWIKTKEDKNEAIKLLRESGYVVDWDDTGYDPGLRQVKITWE